MPDEDSVRSVVRDELVRIGIYADDTLHLAATRGNFVALNEVAPHADDLVAIATRRLEIEDLLTRHAELRRLEEAQARAADEDQRERKNKRYEAFIGFLAGIAQYGAAGAIGYLIGNVITFFKGHH